MARKTKTNGSYICEQSYKKSAKIRLEEFLAVFDKEDTVLICIVADPDSMASAMAIKRLLRYRVKQITIAHPNEISRLNNLEMVDRLRIPLIKMGSVKMSDISKKIIVDSQPDHLPIFEKITFDAIIDHHPLSQEWETPYVDIRPDYGAASSMMVEYLRAAGIKPSVALATALFYGIKVDTQDFEKEARLADGISFRYLFDIANRNLVRKFELTDLRRSELKYFSIALNELKYSKGKFYTHIGKVKNPDILVIIADFLNHVADIDWVLVSGIHGDNLVVIVRCDGYRKNAGDLAAGVFGHLGSAGGHKGAARAQVPLKALELTEYEINSQTLMRLTSNHMS
ncbi:MAG: DHH family phosphoesterase [Desulfofustis sp. PB-SRB1]|jgi:nanoRNase/pAp phosphatase (c-di-AMP/oligoRNAs hydrolase)|nr:DHH family phosphoesterase [Desulfofustis sp. PB-SRB1]MBM1002133.1 DHH family phosphoesterase [Desulfofustis sp. PB-SRB1]HBH30027.1 phosphoethanolamine methyltransferase [Desulfofustis sp.]HBH32617.1 phosphoethanolamine methyltransferase [Desulfofustis sp.]